MKSRKEFGPMKATTENLIRERAYEIWEREGRIHGRALEHWLQAEQDVGARAARKKTKRARAQKQTSARAR